MTDFEVHYRELTDDEDADWTVLPRVSAAATSFTIDGLEDGIEYEIRVRTVDELGSATDWVTTTHLVEAPEREVPPVEGLAAPGSGCLTWRMPANRERLAGFEVRTAPGDARRWGPAEPAHEGLVAGPPFSLCGMPGGERTYMVRAVDVDGNASAPVAIIATLKPFADPHDHELASKDFAAAGFPGAIVGAAVAGGELVAASTPKFWRTSIAEAGPFWDRGSGGRFWAGGLFWKRERRGGGTALFWDPTPGAKFWATRYRAATYTASYTLPQEASGALLTLEVGASVPGWRIEYRRQRSLFWDAPEPGRKFWDRPSAPRFWTTLEEPWLPWPGDLARAQAGLYEFRVTLPPGRTAAALQTFKLTASIEDLEERFLAVPVIPAGTRLPITRTYKSITRVKDIALRGGGLAVGAVVVDLDPVLGPLVQVLDATGAATTGIVDATVQGY